MATTAKSIKDAQGPKFNVRRRNRCRKCGRPARDPLRKFARARRVSRELALRGEVAGVIKSSW